MKKLALLLTTTITAASIVACGNNGNSNSSNHSSSTQTNIANSSTAESSAEDSTESEVSSDSNSENLFIPEAANDNQKAILDEVTESVKAAPKKFDVNNIQKRNLTFWDRMGEEHIMGQTEYAFYDALSELSGGKITADMMISGEIDVDSTNLPEAYTVFDVSRYQLELAAQNGYAKGAAFGLPYVFENRDHFWKFAESDLGKEVIDDINNGGFACHVLSYIEEGARSYFTSSAHPLSSPSDLKGLKLRVQSSDIYNGMVKAVGASPTTMAWSEVYTGISSGVVDGAENPYTGYYANMLYEVAPNFYEDEHIWGACLLSVSSSIWDSLNDDEKELFQEAAEIASVYNKKHIVDTENKIKEECKSKGVTIVTPSAEDKQTLINACAPMYKEYAGEYLDFIDQIKALSK